MIWRIYKYTNIITGQSYIGQTTQSVSKRAGAKGCHYHKELPFRKAIYEYGWENFEQSILRLCTSQEEADQYEKCFIEKYNSIYPNGYNMQNGGKEGGKHHNLSKNIMSALACERHPTKETREKMSESHKGIYHDEEYKKKMSMLNKGKNNPMYGRTGDKNPMYGKKRPNQLWWNDGIHNTRASECPEGFVPGRLVKQKCQNTT